MSHKESFGSPAVEVVAQPASVTSGETYQSIVSIKIKLENLKPLNESDLAFIYAGELVEPILHTKDSRIINLYPMYDNIRIMYIEQKMLDGVELSKKDLEFIYEVNPPIKYLGYKKDPRIAGLLKTRNIEEDMLIIFGCTSQDEIAHNMQEINESTKVYVGPLEPGIFKKLPESLDYVYTSFPGKRIRRVKSHVGVKTGEQLITEVRIAGMGSHDTGMYESVMKNSDFIPSEKPEEINLIRLTVTDLGFKMNEVPFGQICQQAETFGLELCPPDTGPNYRLQYIDQPSQDSVSIAMKPITGSDGNAYIFSLDCIDGRPYLHTTWARPDITFYSDSEFLFRFRKS